MSQQAFEARLNPTAASNPGGEESPAYILACLFFGYATADIIGLFVYYLPEASEAVINGTRRDYSTFYQPGGIFVALLPYLVAIAAATLGYLALLRRWPRQGSGAVAAGLLATAGVIAAAGIPIGEVAHRGLHALGWVADPAPKLSLGELLAPMNVFRFVLQYLAPVLLAALEELARGRGWIKGLGWMGAALFALLMGVVFYLNHRTEDILGAFIGN